MSSSRKDEPEKKYQIASQQNMRSTQILGSCQTQSDGTIVALEQGCKYTDITRYEPDTLDVINTQTVDRCDDLYILPNDYIICANRTCESTVYSNLLAKLDVSLPRILTAVMLNAYLVTMHASMLDLYDCSSGCPTFVSRLDLKAQAIRINGFSVLVALDATRLACADNQKIIFFEMRANQLHYVATRSPGSEDLLLARVHHTSIAALPNDEMISIETCRSGYVKIWNKNYECVRSETHDLALVGSKILLMSDGLSCISMGSQHNEIAIWDLATLSPQCIRLDRVGYIYDFDVLANGNVRVATDAGMRILRFNHILALKLKPEMVEEAKRIVTNDPAGIVADYVGGNVKLEAEKIAALDRIGFFHRCDEEKPSSGNNTIQLRRLS